MTLRDLIKKLGTKTEEMDTEVDFLVYERESGSMICTELSGVGITDLIKLLAKVRGNSTRGDLHAARPSQGKRKDHPQGAGNARPAKPGLRRKTKAG
jgi:hypothetical protein